MRPTLVLVENTNNEPKIQKPKTTMVPSNPLKLLLTNDYQTAEEKQDEII